MIWTNRFTSAAIPPVAADVSPLSLRLPRRTFDFDREDVKLRVRCRQQQAHSLAEIRVRKSHSLITVH